MKQQWVIEVESEFSPVVGATTMLVGPPPFTVEGLVVGKKIISPEEERTGYPYWPYVEPPK